VEENSKTLSQKYLITTEIRVLEWDQVSHSNIGTFLGSVLGLDSEWPTVQTPKESLLLYYLLATNLHKSRISDHTFVFTLHYSEGICILLLLLLTWTKYPMYQSAARPFQRLSKTYISTVLPQCFFTVIEVYNKKDMKLFHKFIDSCGFMHGHSPREKQSSNMKYQFF
jgi:hypothetical protein